MRAAPSIPRHGLALPSRAAHLVTEAAAGNVNFVVQQRRAVVAELGRKRLRESAHRDGRELCGTRRRLGERTHRRRGEEHRGKEERPWRRTSTALRGARGG